MSTIVRIGLLELAFGAMLGWVVAGNFIAPQLLRRAGVVHARRILQAHLDYVIMGIILIAIGLAIDSVAHLDRGRGRLRHPDEPDVVSSVGLQRTAQDARGLSVGDRQFIPGNERRTDARSFSVMTGQR